MKNNHFVHIQENAAKLNAIIDEMASRVKAAEDFLARASVGVVEGVKNPSPYLCYCKIGERWRIAVKDDRAEVNDRLKPWSECNRDVKIQTYKSLPHLLRGIASTLADRVLFAQYAMNRQDLLT